PGQGARVLSERQGLVEVVQGLVRITMDQLDASGEVVGLGVVGIGLQGGVGHLFGSIGVALDEFHLGEIEALELARAANDGVSGAFGEEGYCQVLVEFAAYVHAVDHLADVFLEADGFLLHRAELIVEVVDQHPALFDGELDGVAADDLSLPVVGGHLGVEVFDVGALLYFPGTDGFGDADVHRLRLDGFDEALGDEGDDVGLEGKFDGSVLDRLEQRLEAFHGGGARVDQRLDLQVQGGVADLVHVHGAEGRTAGRGDDDKVVAVNAAIGGRRGEHRLEQDEEAASLVAADG